MHSPLTITGIPSVASAVNQITLRDMRLTGTSRDVPVYFLALTGAYCTYSRGDDRAELTRVGIRRRVALPTDFYFSQLNYSIVRDYRHSFD